MPHVLKDLMISEVSSVDRGAGEGVKVMLMKRDFNSKERKGAAKSGAAMPDGSFPIENKGDLKNAIRLAGNAKDPAKAKAHIKTRAAALGASDMIPDTWAKSFSDNVIDMTGLLKAKLEKDGSIDFDQAQALDDSRDAAGSLMCQLQDAACALNNSVCSIMCDDEVTDKVAAVKESIDQFSEYVANLTPVEKTMTAITAEDIRKQVADAVAAASVETLAKIAKLELENAILKLDPAEFEFVKAKSDDEKKQFAAKSKDDRQKEMDDAKKAATQTLPPEIKKILDEAQSNAVIVKQLQEQNEVTAFAKKATDLGLQSAQGEMLRKAYKGDAGAWVELEKLIGEQSKALAEARRVGKVFTEFGSQQAMTGKAYDLLKAKADELRKTDAKLSEAQAFTKVLLDPANRELAVQEKAERMAQISGHAA